MKSLFKDIAFITFGLFAVIFSSFILYNFAFLPATTVSAEDEDKPIGGFHLIKFMECDCSDGYLSIFIGARCSAETEESQGVDCVNTQTMLYLMDNKTEPLNFTTQMPFTYFLGHRSKIKLCWKQLKLICLPLPGYHVEDYGASW